MMQKEYKTDRSKENRSKKNKKAQIGYTLTWFTATIIIFFILIIYFILAVSISTIKIAEEKIENKLLPKETYYTSSYRISNSILCSKIGISKENENNKDFKIENEVAVIDSLSYWSKDPKGRFDVINKLKSGLEKNLDPFFYYCIELNSRLTPDQEDIYGVNEEVYNFMLRNRKNCEKMLPHFIFTPNGKLKISFMITTKNE